MRSKKSIFAGTCSTHTKNPTPTLKKVSCHIIINNKLEKTISSEPVLEYSLFSECKARWEMIFVLNYVESSPDLVESRRDPVSKCRIIIFELLPNLSDFLSTLITAFVFLILD